MAGNNGKEAAPALPAIPREQQFVHLHLHTEYSLLDGGNRIDKLINRVAELGMTAVGVTDHGNLFGAVAFYQACKDKGIKPILGVEAYVAPGPRTDRTYTGSGDGGFHLVLLAENNKGWENLLYLCSEAYLTGFYYKPRIDREILANHSEGLIAINGHLGSEIGDHLLDFERSGDAKYWEKAVEAARWHDATFNGNREQRAATSEPGTGNREGAASDGSRLAAPGSRFAVRPSRFFIELQHHVPEQNAVNTHLIRLARELNLPLVCDNDAHFLRAEDHDAHDTLVCISIAKNKDDKDRLHYPPELYVKSPAQMRELFAPYGDVGQEALDNTVKIAERCDVKLALGASHAPMVRVRRKDGGAAGRQDGRAAEQVAAATSKATKKGGAQSQWDNLPRHDDPAFGGDLTAWYKAYCAQFEAVPFSVPADATPEQAKALKAQAKAECDEALHRLAEAGFLWRYGLSGSDEVTKSRSDGVEDPGPSSLRHSVTPSLLPDERRARLERELTILCGKGISAYFLIVWDFVNWGRQRGIPATARGSGVGTMVGYVLGLSNACPVRYGLLFERFTDPDRSEYPDIDIDLCQDGRAEVIDYVRTKYGHVAQIITFGTMKARAAIRDVGRVLGISIPEVDKIAKMIPETLGITLDDALVQEPDFKKLYDSDDRVRRLIDNAKTLEGQARHASVHAAGVIVATRPLHEIVPLYKQTGAEDNEIVTQWDGPTCEKMGLLKMDFLGLRTLSIVERAKRLIREGLSEEEIWKAVGRGSEYEQVKRWGGGEVTSKNGTSPAHLPTSPPPHDLPRHAHPLDLDRLTFDDQKVFEMFRRGDTTGVFQFESGGMRRLLVEMKPDRLEDLIAANALFRPGPMDLIPDYNRRKHGQDTVPQVHEIVDRYTAETYGVMVYQEQVMQIVHGLGGITLRDAYTLIKNISKKRHDKIEKERPRFVEGAQKHGLPKADAQNLFELILKFAGYGFNKSHSTGYAIVAYQTAYLKTYFPNQYLAAFLTYESAASKVSEWIPYLEDCRRARFIDPATGKVIRSGVEVRPPDINLSDADFAVVFGPDEKHTAAAGHVRFGLKAIKGVGEKAIEAIMEERDEETKRQRDEVKDGLKVDAVPAHSVSSSLRLSVSSPFSSLFDFCERVLARGPGVLNKATIEALVKCGAFDSVHGFQTRAAMLATIEQAMSAGQKAAQDKASGQGSLFGGSPEAPAETRSQETALAKVPAWSSAEALAQEKEVLGFYVSSHPLDSWRSWYTVFATATTTSLKDLPQDTRVILPGLVQSVRSIVVKNGRSAGQKMAIVTLEDTGGSADCVVFTDAYTKYGHLLDSSGPTAGAVFMLGRLDRSRGDPQVIVERIVPIDGVPVLPGRLQIVLDDGALNGAGQARLARVAEIVKAKGSGGPAGFPLECLVLTEQLAATLAADPRLRIALDPTLVKELEDQLGPRTVRVVGGVTAEVSSGNGRKWERKPEPAGA